jgi:hypothetical protein
MSKSRSKSVTQQPTTLREHLLTEDALRTLRVVESALFKMAEEPSDDNLTRAEISDAAFVLMNARFVIERVTVDEFRSGGAR